MIEDYLKKYEYPLAMEEYEPDSDSNNGSELSDDNKNNKRKNDRYKNRLNGKINDEKEYGIPLNSKIERPSSTAVKVRKRNGRLTEQKTDDKNFLDSMAMYLQNDAKKEKNNKLKFDKITKESCRKHIRISKSQIYIGKYNKIDSLLPLPVKIEEVGTPLRLGCYNNQWRLEFNNEAF